MGGQVSWGFIDQGFNSATNFGLTVVAGRLLGPDGLGIVYIGFSVYLLALSLSRALIMDPIVVVSAHLDRSGREAGGRAAVTMVMTVGGLASVVMALLGLALSGPVARGLLLFSPWVFVSLVQDMWRTSLFRDARGRAATLNDGAWALTMAVLVPVVWTSKSDWLIVTTWGAGAAVSALLGFAQTGLRPVGFRDAWHSWRQHAWSLGRWLALESLVITLEELTVILVLAVLLGPVDVGGLRAVRAVFAPGTLLNGALWLPGLPLLSRSLRTSFAEALKWAVRLSLLALALVLVYFVVVGLERDRILTLVFGKSFTAFDTLIFPIGIGQLFFASYIGFELLVKAAQRGREMLISRIIASTSLVVVTTVLAWTSGLEAAAWGLAIGSACSAIIITRVAVRRPGAGLEAAT